MWLFCEEQEFNVFRFFHFSARDFAAFVQIISVIDMAARIAPERTFFGVNVKQTGGQKDGKRRIQPQINLSCTDGSCTGHMTRQRSQCPHNDLIYKLLFCLVLPGARVVKMCLQ